MNKRILINESKTITELYFKLKEEGISNPQLIVKMIEEFIKYHNIRPGLGGK